jgi:CheY-like chemotaxis protein
MTRPLRVVVVEDEVLIAMDMEQIIAALGHEVVGAAISAPEALDVVRQTRPDLVFMDYQLQGPETGVDAARSVREICDCKIVFVTSQADAATHNRIQAARPFGFIRKPFDEHLIEDCLERAAERQDDA